MSSESLFTSHKVGTISYITKNRLYLKSSANQNKGYITSESSIRLNFFYLMSSETLFTSHKVGTISYVTNMDFNSSRHPITAKF